MVEIGHFPSCPPIEIRKPWNSSSQTRSTVPAFPSVRTTALPTSSDCASSNAPRIIDARRLTDGMDVSEVAGGHSEPLASLGAAPCKMRMDHGCSPRKARACSTLCERERPERGGDQINMLQLYVENATQWNLDGHEAEAVTIQIDAGSGTVCPLTKGASASRIEQVAAAITSGGCPSSARAAGPISSAPSTAASRPRPIATSSERWHGSIAI